MKFLLFKDTEGKYFSPEEYKTLVEAEQTNSEGKIVYLYATDATEQYNYIKAANDKGYNVLLLDGQLDNHFVGLLENKLKDTTLVRVDSDVVENLIRKTDRKAADLSATDRAILTRLFEQASHKVEKASFLVQFEALSTNSNPVVLTQNEYMRRMKEMAAMQPGMNFYGDLPDSYNLVVNTENDIVKGICTRADEALKAEVEPLLATIDKGNADAEAARKDGDNDEAKAKAADAEKSVADARAKMDAAIDAYASKEPKISQLVDLALLANGLLKGESLSAFIARSLSLMK